MDPRWVKKWLIGEIEDPFEAAKWQFKDHWNQIVEWPRNYGQKKNWSAFGAEAVLERVSEHFQFDLETLKERAIRSDLARRCAITLCWDYDEIATFFPHAQQQFGGPDDSASQGPRRPRL